MFLRDDTYCFELLAASVRGERLKALDRPSAESEHRFFVMVEQVGADRDDTPALVGTGP
ncbi:hypothetical protein OG298_39935 [Streptomyces sp. NBC_01005]|uniref:hypothetical protein n=1 Tax=unclassified Streptomyces TaxID=2593676 RepID=UPI0038660279|nr:hypothetical protein OG298_39935 [Streptomyces sp. NBC_01005]WTC99559.1 hypothetical protein OH736_39950 [Streptomyces sp. NBC_01650]